MQEHSICINSAGADRDAGQIGSIEAGKAADIAVRAADPLIGALRPSDLELVIVGRHCHDPAALLDALANEV